MQLKIGSDTSIGAAVGGSEDDPGSDHILAGRHAARTRRVSSRRSSSNKMITNGEEMIMIMLSTRSTADSITARRAAHD
jgi:hypothetical protein